MGRRDHPFLLAVLYIGAAINEPRMLHDLRGTVAVGSTGGMHIRTDPNATLLEAGALLEAGPIGSGLTGDKNQPDPGREYERQTGWTSEEGWASPAVITDGISFMEGIVGMIDDDYPFQCVCKSSRHYLEKMFSKNIPHDVSIPVQVRATLEFWLEKTNGGTQPFQGQASELTQWELMMKQAEANLWGAASGFLQDVGLIHPLRPTSFLELGAHTLNAHRATVALLSTMFSRDADDTQTWNNDDGYGNAYVVDPDRLAKKYNNYNYKYRDGYCEKDTRKPCFPIPGASAGFGLLVALLVPVV